MKDLTLVVVGKDVQEAAAFDLTHVDVGELFLIGNEEGKSLSSIGNRHAETCRTAVLGLVHADCIFGAGALDTFTRAALEGSVCGIVGVSIGYEYRWCSRNSGIVSTLDSCSVFFRLDSGLRFDEDTFDSFHCHVEDLCLQASQKGIHVIVPSAAAEHNGNAWRTIRDVWMPQYEIYRARLGRKWTGTDFITT